MCELSERFHNRFNLNSEQQCYTELKHRNRIGIDSTVIRLCVDYMLVGRYNKVGVHTICM